MKKVLITQRLERTPEHGEEREALDVRWGAFLGEAGLCPVAVPSAVDPAAFAAAVGPVSGVLLTGGNDLSAVSSDPLSARRDAVESALSDLALEQGLPVLGVCRGAQLLGYRYGLRLERVEGHAGTRHPVCFDGCSRWLVPDDATDVNSYHAWGLAGGSEDLVIAARASDGAIEALEHARLPVLGLMWHPERERPFRASDVRLFRRFFGAAP